MSEPNAPRIALIEDDAQIRSFIAYALKNEGMLCLSASTGFDGLALIEREQPDLLLLDLGLPDLDGMQVISRLRAKTQMPVIIVSARDRDEEKVAALDAGADDYLTKPFSANELMARIRVALRHAARLAAPQKEAETVRRIGDLTLDEPRHRALIGDREIHLTPLEFKMLCTLFSYCGKVVTTQTLLREVWGSAYTQDTQALRTLMAGLRRKIEENPAKPRYLITEIGIGYRLRDE